MKVVKLMYDSTEALVCLHLIWFLRLNGIYVHEKLIDLEIDVPSQIQYDDYDAEIYLLHDISSYNRIKKNKLKPNTIFIMYDSLLKNIKLNNYNAVINVSFDKEDNFKNNDDLYLRLINIFRDKKMITENDYNCMMEVAKVFVENEVTKNLVLSKYFYPSDNVSEIDKNVHFYDKTASELISRIKPSSIWYEDKNNHLKYAALYMVYEGNLYCKRHNRSPIYSNLSLNNMTKTFLDNITSNSDMYVSANLLYGQILEDLINEDGYSSYYYSLEKYNSYTLFRFGLTNLWSNPERALKYFLDCVNIFPEYYRAWFLIGHLYFNMEQYDEAKNAFINVSKILENKYYQNVLRPMEIEYFFKSKEKLSAIYEKEENGLLLSFTYQECERIYKAINKTNFLVDLGANNIEAIQEKLKREIDILGLLQKELELYVYVGDKREANLCSKKILEYKRINSDSNYLN